MLKAVLFDLDNTLVNFWEFKQAAAKAASEAMVGAGLPMSPTACEKLIFKIYDLKGVEYQSTLTDVVKPHALMKVESERIRDAGISAYQRAKSQTLKPYPGVVGMLAALRHRYKLAVLTDAPREKAFQRLAFSGLSDYFDAVGSFQDTNYLKPHSEPFLAICRRLAIEPSEALMVGDNPARDIVGAKAVGMKTCLADYGRLFETNGVRADFEAKTPQDLLDIVERLSASA